MLPDVIDDLFQTSTSKPIHTLNKFNSCDTRLLWINLYTEADISSAVGLQRDFRTYWNDKAHEICADKTIRAHLGSKAAIQGTIYTSWTLHKTHLLELQAEELQGVAKQLYNDEIALLADFSTIKNNLERMLQCYASVTTLAERAKSLNIAEKNGKRRRNWKGIVRSEESAKCPPPSNGKEEGRTYSKKDRHWRRRDVNCQFSSSTVHWRNGAAYRNSEKWRWLV